jgi:hypothetical protein
MKRVTILLSVLVAFSMLLSACGTPTAAPATQPPATQPPATAVRHRCLPAPQ